MISLLLEKERKTLIRNATIKALFMALAASLSLTLSGYLWYTHERSNLLDEIVTEAKLGAQVQHDLVTHEMRQMAHTLLFFEKQAQHHQVIFAESEREQVADDFLSFMRTNTSMDQIRVLDTAGLELVRVNFNAGSPYIVSPAQLQNKSNRYYFQQLKKLRSKEIYISELDLNIEKGAVELPHKPVIRMGIRIDDSTGLAGGFLLINFLAEDFLLRFNHSGKLTRGDTFLLNSKGIILSQPEPRQGWKPITESRYSASFPPTIVENLLMMHDNTLKKEGDTYVFSTIHPYSSVLAIPDIEAIQERDSTYWKTVVHLSAAQLTHFMQPIRDILIQWIAIFGLLMLIGTMQFSLLLERKKIITTHINLLNRAMESTSDAIMITKANSDIEYVNAAFTALTGYTAKEAMGNRPSKLLKSHAQQADFYTQLWRTITAGDVWLGELIDRRKDGSFFPAEMSITPMPNVKGEIEHYIAILRDHTERKLLQEHLVQNKKMASLGIAIGGIAHEFNNLLAGLMGNAYLVKSLNKDNPAALAKLTTIEMLGFKAADMIQQMLSYVGKGRIHTSTIHLNKFISDMVAQSRMNIPQTIQFRVEIPASDWIISGDPAALRRLFDELFSNAVLAVAQCAEPMISIELSSGIYKTPHTVLTIQDNGCGILPEHLDMIFEPFFTTREVGQGQGLGLADVYGVAKLHHGYVEVESSPNVGSTFKLYLPLLNPPNPTA